MRRRKVRPVETEPQSEDRFSPGSVLRMESGLRSLFESVDAEHQGHDEETEIDRFINGLREEALFETRF
jgi:hypothetical protein